ncbi:MAG: MerR family transcriptional regulator [Proteobacteria bacterium]|nr:MerR family transcriptional regulator [Pseudomonadota bacterium]
MTKPSAGQVPRKLFKIGEVMAATGISRQTLHDYTVSGFIEEEERTPAGHRLYAEWVFERLAQMAELQREGQPLKEIKRLIDEGKL